MSPSVEPFNEAKYKALMDGQECSEIKFSDVRKTTTLRFDSDYYKKEYLKIEEFIQKNKSCFVSIEKQNLQVDASAFYPSLEPYYNTGDVPFIRVADVKSHIDYNSCVNIPVMGEEFKTLHLCQSGDVVLTKGGRVGTAGLITKPSYVTRDLIFINSSTMSRQDYVTLYMFFASDFAHKQMIRSSSMTAQPHLTITLIRDLLVYNYSDNFKKKIEEYYTRVESLSSNAQFAYSEAEELLKQSLNIDTSFITNSTVSIKNKKSSFDISGRFDAEYYQSKYEKYTQVLNAQDTVGTLCKLYDQNFVPEAEVEYTYVELASVGSAGEIVNAERNWGSELPTRARRKVNAGQIIVSSIEGSLQSCALITSEFDDSLCSTGFYVIDSKDINSETLLVLFKCEIMQSLMKQRCSGSILAGITKDEFLSMPLPSIDENVQKEIAKKVKKSFELRRKSKQLFENTKKAVEMAIEQEEDAALAWLKANVPNLEV